MYKFLVMNVRRKFSNDSRKLVLCSSPNPPYSGPTPVTWPTFTEEEQAYLVLELKSRVERRYKANNMAFWNDLVPKVMELTRNDEKEGKGEEEKAPKDEL